MEIKRFFIHALTKWNKQWDTAVHATLSVSPDVDFCKEATVTDFCVWVVLSLSLLMLRNEDSVGNWVVAVAELICGFCMVVVVIDEFPHVTLTVPLPPPAISKVIVCQPSFDNILVFASNH